MHQAFLLIQATALFMEPQYNARYRLSVFGAVSNVLLSIAIIFHTVIKWSSLDAPKPKDFDRILTTAQFIGSLILIFTYSSVPRRPDVYRGEKVVDQKLTTSILGKLGFSWSGPLLHFAASKKGLEIDDLPEIGYQTRSKTLLQNFDRVGTKDKLWKSLICSHKWAFISQFSLATITSLLSFLPQIALLFILKALEDRESGSDPAFYLWRWVFALGVSIVITSWLEAWLGFTCHSRIGQPILQQLAAVIFAKSMRRKDVKGMSKKTDRIRDTLALDEGIKFKERDRTEKDEDGDDGQKTRQSTINLVGVDSHRISESATYVYTIPATVLKLALAFTFLVNLIGWIPTLAGLAIPALVTQLNVIAFRGYANSQDNLMKTRDKKLAVVTEALQGIRRIKLSALEDNWQQKIMEVRKRELITQWRVFYYDTILVVIWTAGPVLLAAVALATYAIIHKTLSASVAFTAVSVFDILGMNLTVMPELITIYLDAHVSATRIEKYLDSAEKEQHNVTGGAICFRQATIAWPAEDKGTEESPSGLRDLDLKSPNNELSVICGRTGSGKSLLLASILGEADILSGTIQVPRGPPPSERFDQQATAGNWYLEGSLAFVAQIPWIENATIKDNILFGLPLDVFRYRKTLSACALWKDLEMLPDGDLTDVGANGINLSGGQKWRIAFARALYSRASILILDDIFSAVDAHVGRHLFEEALTGELGQGRTRILVTHHVALCTSKMKYLVLLGDGRALYAGTGEELRGNDNLKAILAHDVKEQEQADETRSGCGDDDTRQRTTNLQCNRPRRRSSFTKQDIQPGQTKEPKKFAAEETREQGIVKYTTYAAYIQASGGLRHWLLILLSFIVCLVVVLGRSWWIGIWTRSNRTEPVVFTDFLHPQVYFGHLKDEIDAIRADANLWFYLGIYLAWSVGQCVITTSRYLLVFLGSIKASEILFERLTYAVLRAPLRWLDTVPIGRILNQFTADFNMVDSRISIDLSSILYDAMQVMSAVVAGAILSPWMVVFAVLLFGICMHYALRYLSGAREIKRLESISKSPIYELFGAALTGIDTIRAFDKAEIYVERMHRKIDTYARAYCHLWLFNSWMGLRLNMVGSIFATITAALVVSIRGVDASLAGFALSFALEYHVALVKALRQYANVELSMNAIERVVEYSKIKIEDQSGNPAPAAWPTDGRLDVDNLVVGYAADQPPVLKGVTFSVEQNQRIGVVGRTGAGKSSLILALFRFLEAREGTVLIDGLDISKIKLQDLRSRLAIIPQDPVLFSGTIRSNLDAFDEHSDADLRDALRRVHLISGTDRPSLNESSGSTTPTTSETATETETAPNTTNIFQNLNSKISEGGLNLSQGQRQLLCLARAILSRAKIMILDEATSAVDMETDKDIQRSIRQDFRNSTLIVIAHRLSTVADFDRILVLGDGKVVEFDEPRVLLMGRGRGREGEEGGEFRRMVRESGEREVIEGIILRGEERYQNSEE